jgi:hypothetical protein
MRIHTSLTYQQMRYDVAPASGAPVYVEILEEHGSRTHDRAFEVMLSGSSTSRSQNGEYFAATWDEWGAFFAALYDADPKARCGGSAKRPVYRDAEHYHFVTGGRFWQNEDTGSFLPVDTHPRHHWEYRDVWGEGEGASEAGFRCTKCSAYRPSWQQVDAYAPRSYA